MAFSQFVCCLTYVEGWAVHSACAAANDRSHLMVTAGGLVLKVGLQALLPSFLQLLAQVRGTHTSCVCIQSPLRTLRCCQLLIHLVARPLHSNIQDYAAWSSGDRKRGSSSGSLLAAAGLDSTESDGYKQDAVPADWQQCDAGGVPVRDTQQAGRS